jgi:hypothetical protein
MVTIISLGSSCDTANNLKRVGINNIHYFFDFIWNEYDGLKTVNKIIQTDFSYFEDIKNYCKTTTHPILTWNAFNINKFYPNFVFMHHDTSNKEVIDSFVRKINRTRDVLSSSDKKVFIYYRHYYFDLNFCSDLNILVNESSEFCDMYKTKHNDNFYLLSLITFDTQHDKNKIQEDLLKLKKAETKYLKFDYVFRRNDDNAELNQIAINSWDRVLKNI